MKKVVLLFSVFMSLVVFADGSHDNHATHDSHTHKHGLDCGHAAEWHIDHFDYEHDGHDHHQLSGQVHEADFKTHDNHDHDHGLNCGHISRVNKGITEYQHDGHWHHQHGSHIHETHSPD